MKQREFRRHASALCVVALGLGMATVAPDARSQPLPLPKPLPQDPQLNECLQFTQANGVGLTVTATPTSPTSVTITWQGFAGDYTVKAAGFQTSVHLAPPIARSGPGLERSPGLDRGTLPSKPSTAPAMLAATAVHTPTSPDANYHYIVTATLPDGRKACGQASAKTPPLPTPAPVKPLHGTIAKKLPLKGWADLHTHPMSNLAFGGQIFWGGPDEQALLGMDSSCHPMTRAKDMFSALGPENSCNNVLRQALVKTVQGQGVVTGDTSVGAPGFTHWPKWNDVAHQKMWFEWIERARKYGNLRVMVGLSHNNMALAKASGGAAPQTDKESSELQIKEMKDFILRHKETMEVALDSAQVYSIASSGRIAVILGIEVDNLGNGAWTLPNKTKEQAVTDEIQNLFNQGVRYVFPIHLTDNQFGGTAIYDTTFVTANIAQNGALWDVECTPCADEIGHSLPKELSESIDIMKGLGLAPMVKPIAQCLPMGGCGHIPGHRNVKGLTPLGEFAMKELMKRGMIIDIDHMSQKSAERALQIAESMSYPVMSGHTGLRNGSVEHRNAENSRTASQIQRIAALGGMVGQGTDSADAWAWANDYLDIAKLMGNRAGSVAIGTDMNSLVHSPKPSGRVMSYTPERPPGQAELETDFPMSISTAKGPHRAWNYAFDGVANYGMMADFIRDMRMAPGKDGISGQSIVDDRLLKSADYFWRMWEHCEAQKTNIH